jgi:hypothetical protein
MKKTFTSFVFAAAALSQLGSTDCGQVIRDPGFDLWCGDSLCAWKLERGSIAKVPTWNEGDPGVELVGTDVAIEQLSPVTSADDNSHCIEFDLIANVDDTAELDLNIDVFGDGSVEHTERIPTARWQPLIYKLPIGGPGPYAGIRFELVKKGDGRAMVAQLQASTSTGCDGLTPIVPAPAPNGAPCASGAGCQSGTCGPKGNLFEGQCVGCLGGDCGSQTCGLGDPLSPVYGVPLECVNTHARQLGEQCFFDIECAAAAPFCTGVCSTCKADHSGCTCEPAWPGNAPHSPLVCDPSGHARATGEPCANDADCASSSCAGSARMQCEDGRPCATAADCPFVDLQNGPCINVGVQGGTCR